jgi:hypothetical protein
VVVPKVAAAAKVVVAVDAVNLAIQALVEIGQAQLATNQVVIAATHHHPKANN